MRYDFSANGYVAEVRNDDIGNALFCWLDEQTAESQIKQGTLGNNVTSVYTYVPQTGLIDTTKTSG